MIRALTDASRSIPFPNHLLILHRAADAISHRAFARCFSSYAQPFPYHGEPVDRYHPDPFPTYHSDRFRYQSDHNSGHFHPGPSSRGSRLGHPFGSEFESYPGSVSWRGNGSVCYCRCCGRPLWGYHQQQYQPVNYGIGNYRDEGVQGIGYDHGGRYQMRTDYYRNHNGSRFHATDGRSYGGSSSYYPRNSYVNVGQHRNNLGDGHIDTVGVSREKWSEDKNFANRGYTYRQRQNSGGNGRDHNVWSQSTSNYSQYGLEHRLYSESDKFHQRAGHVGPKNSLTNDQNGGRSVCGQSQDVAVNGHPMNSDGASGKFQHSRQSSGISDVLRNETHHGSCEGSQNVNKNTSSNPAGVWGNYGHGDLNNRYYENSNGFSQNLNVSHGQNLNIDTNGGWHQKRFSPNANVGEAGTIFQDNQSFKLDSFNVSYGQTKEVNTLNSLRNPNGPFPKFGATNQPLKSTVTSFETNQMPDINASRNDVRSFPRRMADVGNDVSHRSNQAVGQCQRIIDVLETEDKYGPKGPGNRSVSQPRNQPG